MKFIKLLSFLLYLFLFVLLFNSCTTPLTELPPEMNDDAEIHFYTEYEGVASMSTDLERVFISSSDQPERDGLIELRWSFQEHIYFVSKDFEFDISDCTIWGADSCAQLAYNVKEDNEDEEGRSWIYFEPSTDFWRCMATENCDPGDAVFYFYLMAREK